MIKKTNTLLASAVAAGVLMMAAQGAAAAEKAAASSSPAAAIEQRMKMMEEQMQMLKAELARTRSEGASARKVEDLEAKVAKAQEHEKAHHNLLFFRGGFAKNDHDRGNALGLDTDTGNHGGALSSLSGILGGEGANGGDDAWYFGAGFDFRLTDDIWGLTAGTPLEDTAIDGELMFEYKKFDHQSFDSTPLQAVAELAAGVPVGTLGGGSVTISQLSLSASPKIKFMQNSDFRPWIIPLGFVMEINSPPSDGVTYLNPGMMFGAGADYRLWKDIFVGADARYHLTGSDNDGVDTDGFTAGGYLGIGF